MEEVEEQPLHIMLFSENALLQIGIPAQLFAINILNLVSLQVQDALDRQEEFKVKARTFERSNFLIVHCDFSQT